MYYFGRAIQQAGRPDDACEALREFFAVCGTRTGLMDDAVWNMALCEEKSGRAEAAITTFDRLARDFSYSPQVPPGLLRAAGLCETAGRAEEARARYERIVKDLAGTKEAEQAAAKLNPPLK
jgi:TolA-binding protein